MEAEKGDQFDDFGVAAFVEQVFFRGDILTAQTSGGINMDALIMEKSPPLQGTVRVSNSKNAILPILAASLLCTQPVTIRGIPQISDVEALYAMLTCYGAEVTAAPDACRIYFEKIKSCPTPYELVRRLRASFLVTGPLLARAGFCSIALPGGCAIGTRPIDLHLKGLKALGASIKISEGMVHAHCKKLKGASIYLDFPSVGATEHIMMTAVLARGRTMIQNAATEPEITDLASFLNAMGANISGAGTDTIHIKGVKALRGGEYTPIPDRIEAGTLMIAAAMTAGDVTLKNVRLDHIQQIKFKLIEAGAKVEEETDSVRVIGPKQLKAIQVRSLPYPGFATDLQAPIMAMACISKGTSVVTETVFDNRFQHVPELIRMDANIRVEDRSAIVEGQSSLQGAQVCAPDLRGAAALVLAGLCAQGHTQITGIEHLDRGYDALEDKLNALGAKIHRQSL